MAEEDDKRPESGALKGTRAGQRRRVPPTIDLAPSEVTPVAEPRGSLADEPLDPASEMPLDAALPPEPSEAEPSGAEPSRAEPSAPSSSFDTPASPANGSRMTDTDRAPSTSPPSGGIGSAFPVAILGALAGLILVFFAAALGLLPINDRRAAESLERVTALQQSVASLRSSQAASDLGPLTQRVADLESASAALGPVQDRLAALDQQLQALAVSVPPDLAAQISTLAADLGALREEVAAASTVNPDSPLAVAGAVTDLPPRLAAAEDRLTALDPARLDALTAELGDLSRQLSAIDQRLVRVEAAPSVAEEARRTAEIMAVGVLRGAASRGEPFKAELDLVDALGVDHPALAELAPLAETGTPTAEALSASFQPAVMDQILAATEAIPPDANFLDRMVSGVRSLVSVRPAGPIEGTTPVAIVSRIRAALQAGDLAAAAAEWDSLPEAGKAPSAGWAAQLKARIAVDAALNDLAAALAPAPPDTPAPPNAPPG
jgi:hypothetical protein